MRIAIGCDHAGFTLKGPLLAALEADGHDVLDLGTFSVDPVDYPDFAKSVGQAVLRSFVDAGVLVCGSGVGASIAANKLRGVRAALCHDLFTARQSREDDDANVLCLGARVLDETTVLEVTRAWLGARFSGEERHLRRLAKVAQLDASLPADRGAPPPARVAAPAPAAPSPTPKPAAPAAAPAPSPRHGASRTAASTPHPTPAREAGPSRPADSLAARAAELIRQFTERHPEDQPAKREGIHSLDEDDDAATLEVVMPETAAPPRARRPEPKPPAPSKAAPEPKPSAARGAPAEPRSRPTEVPAPAARAADVDSRGRTADVVPPPKPVEPPAPLPDAFRLAPVQEALQALESADFLGRMWVKDVELWNGDATEIRNRLGWLTSPTIMGQHADDLKVFADEIRRLQYTHVVLLGMGGSSLCSDVFIQAFGSKMGFPDLLMLDSTDPGAVQRVVERINVARTVFVVSTKSGTTIETLSFYAFFRHLVEANSSPKPGLQFVAITDPGTPLEKLARDAAFRRAFLNPPTIGGRYSALSFFGLVPAALIGVDVRTLLDRAHAMVEACGHEVPVRGNPGVRLGAALAGLARHGRDKVTLVFSDKVRSLGAWIEQLLAESLGKNGTGLIPVDDEPLGPPAVYGDDRVFVAVLLEDDRSHDPALVKLAGAGHPVIRLMLKDPLDVGAEFFRWEVATAAAGALLGVNPFDEPDVASAKEKTAAILNTFKKTRRLPEGRVAAEEDGIGLMTATDRASERKKLASVSEGVAAHLAQVQPGDYVAFQAYLSPHAEAGSRLQALRTVVRDRYRVATTVAYGPRYLHSTGQLHKGGPATGVFVLLTGDDAEDVRIPGAGHGFSTLKAAQALGDLEALSAAGRRVIRLHLKGRQTSGLDKVVQLFRSAAKKP